MPRPSPVVAHRTKQVLSEHHRGDDANHGYPTQRQDGGQGVGTQEQRRKARQRIGTGTQLPCVGEETPDLQFRVATGSTFVNVLQRSPAQPTTQNGTTAQRIARDAP